MSECCGGTSLQPCDSWRPAVFLPSSSSLSPYLDDTTQINNSSNSKLRSQHALHFCVSLLARKLSPGCRKAAWDYFFFPSCQAKLWHKAYSLLHAFFPTSPPLCFGKKLSFQLERACAMPNTPPNFHQESRNLHTNTRKLGSSLLLGERY